MASDDITPLDTTQALAQLNQLYNKFRALEHGRQLLMAVQNAESRLSTLSAEIRNEEAVLSESNKNLKEALQDSEKQLSELEKNKEVLQTAVDKLKDEHETIKGSRNRLIDDTKAEHEALMKEQTAMFESVKKSHTESLEALTNEVVEQRKTLAALKDSINQLKSSLAAVG